MAQRIGNEQRTGIAAIASILLAFGSYIATCTGHPIWGLVVAILALPAGGLGLLFAASPRVKGAWLSIGAMVLAAVGVVIAILGMIGVAIF